MGKAELAERWMAGSRLERPTTRAQLRNWISLYLSLDMPDKSVCGHHQTPLDYLEHSFFERGMHSPDAVIWACRGGGKTMIGAVSTLLDCLFKPGLQIRILGGSIEQSQKMYRYLDMMVREHFADQLADLPTQRRLTFINGSQVEVLAQSDQSVRGQRVQKLRCDEVELFDPRVWQAAQLTTRSTPDARGSVEAFSTMHKPGGLMQEILSDTQASSRKTFAWCIWDVIHQCPNNRECAACPLWHSCGGIAKGACGFVEISDVIAMHERVSKATWNHEMLCLPPKLENAVFPSFSRGLHVRTFDTSAVAPGSHVCVDGRTMRVEQMICGVDFGFRDAFVCLWVALLHEGGKPVVWVVDEMVTQRTTVQKNADAMRQRGWAIDRVYCDVAGEQFNSQTGIPDVRVLRNTGFDVRCRAMQIEDGIAAISELVDPAGGPARLLVEPRCKALIAAFEGYARDRNGDPFKDKEHDHLIDALRYAVVNHLGVGHRTERRFY